ncbi:hypothetical protein [Baekduia sp. Peel2402]|uniref:hypothetical protein n=1 Tax=Baekduia sp. Peel2402 TaxID=3458296 RepID=UPI00403E547F
MFRKVLGAALAVVAAAACSSAAQAAAPPVPGFYTGTSASGITAALSVEVGAKGPYVSRIGAICRTSDPMGNLVDTPTTGQDGDGNDAAFTIEADGLWGYWGDDSPVDREYGGSVDGSTAVFNLSNNASVVRACDPGADPEHANGVHRYPITLTRTADKPPAVSPGRWTRQEPGGQPGHFYVWAGGAFAGRFDGSPYVGQEDPPQCAVTPASLVGGAQIAAGGAFTLPWEIPVSLPSFQPVTPTKGQLSGGSGTWTYIIDSPYVKDTQLSGCTPPASTTVQVSLDTPQNEGAPQPVTRPPGPPPTTTPPAAGPAGGTAASTTCPNGTFKTTAGPFVLCSAAKPAVSGSTATLSGRVTINGFLFLSTSKISVDVSRAAIRTSGDADFGVIVGGTDLRLARTAFDVTAAGLRGFHLPGLSSQLKLGGLPIELSRVGGQAPSVSIDLGAGTIALSAGISYKLAGAALAASGKVSFGTPGISGELSTKGFSAPLRIAGRQLFELKELGFSFNQADASWKVSGGGSISLPTAGTVSASASGGVKDGRFDSLSLALAAGAGGGVAGPYGTFFSGGSFDLANAAQGLASITVGVGIDGGWPFKVKKAVGIGFHGEGSFDVADLQLHLGATAQVTATDVTLANGEGSIDMDFDDGEFALATNVNVLDLVHGSTTLQVTGSSFLSRGKLSVEFGPSSEPIKFIHDHWPFGFFHDAPDHLGPLLTGDALISNLGAGARTSIDVWKLHAGATVIKKWGSPLDYDVGWGSTKTLTSIDPTAASAAQSGAVKRGAVRVPRGLQALVLQAPGSGQIVVRDPKGHVVADTSKVTTPTQELAGGRVLVGRLNGLVGVVVRSPARGRWRVQGAGVTSTLLAARAGELARIAKISGRRVRPGSRLTLRLRRPAGTSVEIRAARRKGDDGVPIATTTRSAVRVRVPRTFRGARLRLVAVTRRAGVPIGRRNGPRTVRVSQPKPTRASRLRITRGSKTTTVRFRRGGASVRSIVTVTVAGRRYEQLVRGSHATFRFSTRKRRVTATVSPVRADGRVTKATSKTVR